MISFGFFTAKIVGVCVGVLVICVLVFTVFMNCFVHVYLFLSYFCLIL